MLMNKTNKENYKQAFSVLHASGSRIMEEENMNEKKRTYIMKKVMAACASAALILGSLTAAYAADVGGIREKITIWFHGERFEAEIIDRGNGTLTASFYDEDGEAKEISGGGAGFDEFGNEIPLSKEEILDGMGIGQEVLRDKDGKVWFYINDKKIEITDLFQEDGVCRVAVETDGNMRYYSIEEDGEGEYGWQMTTEKPEDAERYVAAE